MNNGELTAEVARALTGRFRSRAEILFDHGNQEIEGPDRVGLIRAWFGDTLNRRALLADLDIAVLLPQSNRALLLIEVEESAANPKKLLGDACAALIAEHFTFQRKRDLEVGDWTNLLVLVRSATHAEVSAFLSGKLEEINSSHFGQVVLDTFKDKAELEEKLTHRIELALHTL
jgi:hypothetical protein